MKILITGSSGQLGKALIKTSKNLLKKDNFELIHPPKNTLNLLSNNELLKEFINDIKPDWIINCAAYTAVDNAENEKELAYKINAEAPKSFAESLLINKGKLIQISTDFVFSGEQNLPYRPNQEINPQNIYGKSKGLGEKYILKILQDRSYIIRTSWLYGPVGNNFLLTMLKLHECKGIQNEVLKVVYDQISSATSTLSLAKLCWHLILEVSNEHIPKIMHWSNLGVCSWYDFAYEIGEQALEKGILKKIAKVVPISSNEYPSLAKRPNYSLLDCRETINHLNFPSEHWKKELSFVLDEIKLYQQ